MKIVECPSCETKFDIFGLPDGTKLKCSSCKNIFGVVRDGEAIPLRKKEVASVKPRTLHPARRPVQYEEEYEESEEFSDEPEYDEEEVRVRRHRRPHGGRHYEDDLAVVKPRPDFLLILGGLIGLGLIGTLVYVIMTLKQPIETLILGNK